MENKAPGGPSPFLNAYPPAPGGAFPPEMPGRAAPFPGPAEGGSPGHPGGLPGGAPAGSPFLSAFGAGPASSGLEGSRSAAFPQTAYPGPGEADPPPPALAAGAGFGGAPAFAGPAAFESLPAQEDYRPVPAPAFEAFPPQMQDEAPPSSPSSSGSAFALLSIDDAYPSAPETPPAPAGEHPFMAVDMPSVRMGVLSQEELLSGMAPKPSEARRPEEIPTAASLAPSPTPSALPSPTPSALPSAAGLVLAPTLPSSFDVTGSRMLSRAAMAGDTASQVPPPEEARRTLAPNLNPPANPPTSSLAPLSPSTLPSSAPPANLSPSASQALLRDASESRAQRRFFPVTTTGGFEGQGVGEYLGPVGAEMVLPKDVILCNPAPYGEFNRIRAAEDCLRKARILVLEEAVQRAKKMGADGILGYRLQYTQLDGNVFLVAAQGTAVRFDAPR